MFRIVIFKSVLIVICVQNEQKVVIMNIVDILIFVETIDYTSLLNPFYCYCYCIDLLCMFLYSLYFFNNFQMIITYTYICEPNYRDIYNLYVTITHILNSSINKC